MEVVLTGEIEEFTPMGEVVQYTGKLLRPGTWKGIDGNEISYSAPILNEGAKTFSGTRIVHSHRDRSQGAVKGFNSVAWFDGEWIRNRGFVFDPETVRQIKTGEYPMGQSMEASVFVDAHMNAVKLSGNQVAIGVEKPAVLGAQQDSVREIKLEKGKMGKFAEEVKAKVTAIMGDDKVTDKVTAVQTMLGELVQFVEPDKVAESKYVLLADTTYAQMKADATAKPDDKRIETLETKLAAMEEAGRKTQLAELDGKIKKFDKDFKIDTYLEGVTDHIMKVRMLTSYLAAFQKMEPILPKPTVESVKLEDADLDKYAMEVYGGKFEDTLRLITNAEVKTS